MFPSQLNLVDDGADGEENLSNVEEWKGCEWNRKEMLEKMKTTSEC